MKKKPSLKTMPNKSKKRVLLTGATGFVGANLARRLLSEGYEVHILTRKTSDRWRLTNILPSLHDHIVDLREAAKLNKIIGSIKPDTIFHLATTAIYGGVHLPEKDLIDINLLGTFNLINACEKINYSCFINTGTSSEYGPKPDRMRETDICQPINMYGITKLAAALYAQLVAKFSKKPIIHLRLFSPYGPYDDKSRLMTYAIVQALQGKELRLADINAVRDYIYIDDVVDIYLSGIKKAKDLAGEIFNVGSGHQTRIAYVVDRVIKLTNSKSQVRWQAIRGRSYDTKRWEAEITKTHQAFNWSVRHSIDCGIEKTVSWFRNNLHWYANK